MPDKALADPGSFRDPDSRVIRRGDDVLRVLSSRGLADWEALEATEFFGRTVAEGRLVETRRVDRPEAIEGPDGQPAAGVLRHSPIPFVTYPYEWPATMLRDAALLELELMEAALDEGMILKDASPYNVQWRGTAPVFIDVGSFERLREGEPWAGYRQFCMLFLYPLMLTAFRGIPHQPWLRGALEGITPQECRRALSLRDRLRRGVLSHVVLHSRLESRQAETRRDVGTEMRRAGFRAELIQANVRRLQRIVRGLRLETPGSAWSGYRDDCSYTASDGEQKEAYLRECLAGRRLRLVWDIGCNDGHFSRIAAEAADTVLAIDSDAAVVDRLYRELRDEPGGAITPLVVDVTDPSPGLGWAGAERAPLTERGRPDLALCLALIHHVVIGSNIPLGDFLSWLAGLASEVVIEFVDRDDPMVRRMLARKGEDSHPDYDRPTFERALEARFDIGRRQPLGSGTRTLYSATPLPSGRDRGTARSTSFTPPDRALPPNPPQPAT